MQINLTEKGVSMQTVSRVLSVLVVSVLVGGPVSAASKGPNSPGTVVNDDSIGVQPWLDPELASASDDSGAAALTSGGNPTQYLKATDFGLAIAPLAIIAGIEVQIEKSAPFGSVTDYAVRIVKGGVIGSEDRSEAGLWPGTDTIVTYGGPDDLWGESWTADDINSADFGVAISATDGGLSLAIVDHIAVSVYFAFPTPEHFKCYKAKDLKNPKFSPVNVLLNDQFGINDGTFEVKKPFLACNPADKNGEGIYNFLDHLTCYKIKGPKLEKTDRPQVRVVNQLGTIDLEAKKPFLLCVPSAKTLLP